MTTFTVHTPDTAPDAARATLAAVEKSWGFLPKLHAVLAESPAALDAYATLFDIAARSGLTPAELQVAYLTFSVFHGCEYCTMGHTWLARNAGLDEASVQALRGGRALPDARLEALRVFADALVRRRGDVGDAAVDAFIAAGYRRSDALDLLVVLAAKTISNYANHIAHTPHEAFMADPSLAWRAAPVAIAA